MSEAKSPKVTGFWVLTGLIVVSQGISGVMDVLHASPVLTGVTGLGYPAYVLYILGPFKLAGAFTLAAPGMLKVKEWAYAGFVFDFVGAFASHLFNGDGPDKMMPPLVLLAVLVGSYYLRPADRRWG